MITRLLSFLTEKAYAADLSLNLPTGPVDSGAGTGVSALLNRILELILAFAYPLAFLSIIYSAYLLITSAGKPEAYAATKKNIAYLVTGIIIIFAAVYIVRFVLSIFGGRAQ